MPLAAPRASFLGERFAFARGPRFATLAVRLEPAHADAVLQRVRAWTADLGKDDVEALARTHGFAAARVVSAADRYDDPHLRARGAVWDHEDALYGPMVEQGPAPKLSATQPTKGEPSGVPPMKRSV